jgi:type II secretory pathway pseudopilin PulG
MARCSRPGELSSFAGAGPQRGFTYIGLLMTVAIMGLLLTLVARVWATTEQREREKQLLWVGHAYRMAISSYFAAGHRFPATLQDLLQDERTPVPTHHLRRLYPDPMSGKPDWTLVLTPDGQGIMGVNSSTKVVPLKRRNFDFNDQAFEDSDCICQWQFVYYPSRYMRGVGNPTTTGGSALTPANTEGQAGKPVDSFKPGTISTQSPNSASPLSSGNPFAPGGSSTNTPGSDTGGSN